MRKLRMSVHNEAIQLQNLKFNSVSNASLVLIGDADLVTPQTQTISQQVPSPRQASTTPVTPAPTTSAPTSPASVSKQSPSPQ